MTLADVLSTIWAHKGKWICGIILVGGPVIYGIHEYQHSITVGYEQKVINQLQSINEAIKQGRGEYVKEQLFDLHIGLLSSHAPHRQQIIDEFVIPYEDMIKSMPLSSQISNPLNIPK